MLGLCQGLWLAAYRSWKPSTLDWSSHVQLMADLAMLVSILDRMPCIYGSYAWYGEMA